MIYDRDYMREPEASPIRVSMILIWVLGGCFLVQCILTLYGNVPVVADLGLSWAGIRQWQIWRLLTFQFLHEVPWPLHVISNALGLYFFGRPVEERLGTWKFLALYLAGGVAGGLAQVAWNLALQYPPQVSLMGASAGVSAITAVYCRWFAHDRFTAILMVFPVRMKFLTFLWILVAGSVVGLFFKGSGVAHMAHLGGLALGWFAVPFLTRTDPWQIWKPREEMEPATVIPFPGTTASRAVEVSIRKSRAEEDAEYVAREVDPILDKIASKGLASLTDHERRILEQARERMRKG
jgi:membrane associated rhomboid family serine protease